jgi:GT2 family glycosyltransferase
VEPKRGITFARNRAIAEAGPVDFVAFIDDDEIPSAQWLDELLWAQAEFAGDVVSGPVVPRFAPEVADWVKSGGFFDARISATGTPRKTCACNNVLIAAEVFRRIQHFDHAFALSGAEDTNFFLRVSEAGCKIVWSQEAFVVETINSARANVAWLLRREYQTGNGWVFCEAGVNSSLRSWMFRFAKSCGHIVIGLLNAFFRLLTLDKAGVVRAAQRVSLGTGMLSALLGYRFMAYQNAGTNLIGTGNLASKFE